MMGWGREIPAYAGMTGWVREWRDGDGGFPPTRE